MKKQYSILWLIAVALVATFTFTACSSDDDDNNSNKESERFESNDYDDLNYFQCAIVNVDSLGNFLCRQYGVPLYDNDTTHLYLGVESLEVAEQVFRKWLAPDIKAETAADKSLTVNLTDEEGKAQGTVFFRPGTGGTVAEVTVSPETKLKHFSQITFMLNSAWPLNSAKSKWHVGDIVRNIHIDEDIEDRFEDGDIPRDWVCVREAGTKNIGVGFVMGVNPMFCAITKQSYNIPFYLFNSRHIKTSKYCPSLAVAENIREELNKDWDFFAACFDEVGRGKLSDVGCWINYIHGTFVTFTEIYSYQSGSHYGVASAFSDCQPFLLKIDWVPDGEMHDGGTY